MTTIEREKIIKSAQKSLMNMIAHPLVGVDLELIRADMEKIEASVTPEVWLFISAAYNAALNSSDTKMESEYFGIAK